MTTSDYFRTRADAVRAARGFVWGDDVPLSRREFVDPRTRPDFAVYVDGLPRMAVVAQVNNHLLLIEFDHYGRHTRTETLS